MNKHDLNQTYDKLSPTPEQKERMLKNILSHTQEPSNETKKVIQLNLRKKKQLMTLAASFILVFGIGVVLQQSITLNDTEFQSPPSSTSPPSSESPTGERKIFNYNDSRYVYINDGEPFPLTSTELGEPLGTLTDSSSFANGSTLYSLTAYATDFRIAIEQDGNYFIAENVGPSDDGTFDITAYFKALDLTTHTKKVEILDHRGINVLRTLTNEDVQKVITAFANAEVATLSPQDYEVISHAQVEGDSYLIIFTLKDDTVVTFYVIPSQNYVTIGDFTCTSPDLNTSIGYLFDGLTQ